MLKAAPLLLLLLLQYCVSEAQVKKETMPLPQAFLEDTVPAGIQVDGNGDSLHFAALLRPLRPVAGAPASFYTYFWELGDGSFSFARNPVHVYGDTGTYQVRLYATNNYDDGKAPPTRPRPVKVNHKPSRTGTWASGFFHGSGNIEMKINRNPRPGEDFAAVIGYRNQSMDSLGGAVVLFFNERQFSQAGFALADKRYYYGEDSSSIPALMAQLSAAPVPGDGMLAGPQLTDYTPGYANDSRSMLQALQSNYTQHTVLHFDRLRQGNERFLFMDINTLPSMIADTNATVTISALLVPDNGVAPPELYELEMQIVASHDPNRLQLKQRRINYRFMGKRKELTYKVRFQNTGKGPARKVAIGIAMPRQLNTNTIVLQDMSPHCGWCDSAYSKQSCIDTIRTADSVYFVFNNIYLPGLQQEGVSDQDSTKGFVAYTIRFKKRPKKIAFSSRAAIVFDKNEPVYTNKATGSFIKGISPGIMAGYNFSSGSGLQTVKGPLQLGFTLSPYAPSKPYFQAELHASLMEKQSSTTGFVQAKGDTTLGGQLYLISGRQRSITIQRNLLQLVPLHYRYNFNSWIGIGAGAMIQVAVSEQTSVTDKAYLASPQQPAVIIGTTSVSGTQATHWFAYWNAAPFADIQLGRVKSGPAVGLRYQHQLRGDIPNRFLVYAAFRL